MLADCAGEKRESVQQHSEPSWMFEGWACAPDQSRLPVGPHDYCDDAGPKEALYLLHAPPTGLVLSDRIDDAVCRRAGQAWMQRDADAIFARRVLDIVQSFGEDRGPCRIVGRSPFREAGVYDCCAIHAETGRCDGRGAGTGCTCMLYAYVPGGQKAFEESDWIRCR